MEQTTENGERPIVKKVRREVFAVCIAAGILCLITFTALYFYAPGQMPAIRFHKYSEMKLPWSAEILKECKDLGGMDQAYFLKFKASEKDIAKLLRSFPDWVGNGKWEEGKLDFQWREEENASGENFRQFRSVTGTTVFWTLGIDTEKSVVFFEYYTM